MASHLEAVGFPVDGADEMQQLLDQALTRARTSGNEVEHSEGRTLQYVDPSGAAITIHIDHEDRIECMKPGFVGESRFWWRPLNVYPDGDCRFCDLVFAEFLGEEAAEDEYYSLALEVETIGADRALIPYGDVGEVTFAALCIDGQVSESESEFRQAQEAEWASAEVPEALADTIPALRGFASKSLVPSGLFTENGPPSSEILAFGIVASVEERQNQLGGARFMLVRLDTLGGTFETCIAPGTLDGEELLKPGAVVGGMFWLVGRPLTLRDTPGAVPTAEPARKASGILGRLFGRTKR